MKIPILTILFLVAQVQAQSIIDSPKFCFKRNHYPCAVEFSQKLKMSHQSFDLEATPKTQIYFKTENEWKLISGKVLVSTKKDINWLLLGTQKISVQGEFMMFESDQAAFYFYQLSGKSKFGSQELHPGFYIKINKGKWQNPEPIKRDQVIKFYALFKKIDSQVLEQWQLEWGNQIEQASQAYRLLASELDQAKENKRLDQIRLNQEKEAEDLKYKEAFRVRYFNPEKWSELIETSNLSP